MKKRHIDASKEKSRRVVFIAFPQVALLDLTGPWEVLSLANTLSRTEIPPYDLELVSGDDSATIVSGGGISMVSHRAATSCRGAIDTLIVPAADLDRIAEPTDRSSKVLQRLARRSRRVVSICAGAFFLA
ncbi:MAG: GlxA family transcriptional regulator, partial [Cyanobacteria bacterium J06597_1]